jgi:hypothetical protein
MGPDKIYIESDISVFIDAPPRMSRWQLTSEELASERCQPASWWLYHAASSEEAALNRASSEACSFTVASVGILPRARAFVSQSVIAGRAIA